MQVEQDEKIGVPDVSELESGYGHALRTNAPVELDKSDLSAITFSQIVNQIWHFVSVDYGPRCKWRCFVGLGQADSNGRYVHWV